MVANIGFRRAAGHELKINAEPTAAALLGARPFLASECFLFIARVWKPPGAILFQRHICWYLKKSRAIVRNDICWRISSRVLRHRRRSIA